MKLTNVIVTGGTGLTGNALIRYLIKNNICVTALVRRNSSRVQNIPVDDKVKIVECNIDEYEKIDNELTGKYDAFFHLAWDGSLGNEKVDNRYNVPLQMNNLLCFIQAVELCNRIGCKKFIATGTQAEYGPVDDIINEDTPLHPNTAYGSAKVCAHDMSKILCDRFGITLIWARLFSIYGPRDGAKSLIDTAVREMIINEKSISYSSGKQIWNYLFSYDAAKALTLLAEKIDSSDTFCVASSHERPLREYVIAMHSVVNESIEPRFGDYVPDKIINIKVDASKLKKATDFIEDYSFENGIAEVVNEIKDRL